jgi:hypothetical protein
MYDAFYFGCWSQPGHHLFTVDGMGTHERRDDFPRDFPVKIHVLDTGLLGYDTKEEQGEAVLSHIGKWTILSFWDRSIDKRGQCNSNFILRGILTFGDALAVAKSKFPSIFARIHFEIRERV